MAFRFPSFLAHDRGGGDEMKSPAGPSASKKAAKFYDRYHHTFAVVDEDAPVIRKTMDFNRDVLRFLAPAPGASLLDLSCGQGLFLKAAVQESPSLVLGGLDHSEVAVQGATARVPTAAIKKGDALKTPYADRHFDYVTCLGALEHYPDSAKGLREIRRILKDGGRAVVYVPNLFFLGYVFLVWRSGETPHEAGQNEYERFETRQGWEDLIRQSGFRVLAVRKYNDMFASERFNPLVKFLYQILVRPFIPLNLSYCFAFLLEKDPSWKAR
jgi:ubiquinone/menaquinone biosynthesis C-methylase UbiE